MNGQTFGLGKMEIEVSNGLVQPSKNRRTELL